jgi:hypothetical protein
MPRAAATATAVAPEAPRLPTRATAIALCRGPGALVVLLPTAAVVAAAAVSGRV